MKNNNKKKPAAKVTHTPAHNAQKPKSPVQQPVVAPKGKQTAQSQHKNQYQLQLQESQNLNKIAILMFIIILWEYNFKQNLRYYYVRCLGTLR